MSCIDSNWVTARVDNAILYVKVYVSKPIHRNFPVLSSVHTFLNCSWISFLKVLLTARALLTSLVFLMAKSILAIRLSVIGEAALLLRGQ